MHTDWFFTMGKAHHVCEDYAIDGDKCVIVSDGCSSSKHTDLGARLLAHSARILINTEKSYADFGRAVVAQAAKLLDTLNMGYECLYATLIVAKATDLGSVRVRMYGDGAIIAISKGSIETMEISYTNNMPFYLAYNVDPVSMELYKKYNNEMTIIHSVDGEVVELATSYDNPVEYTFDSDTVLISSDGLGNFEDSQSRLLIPFSGIVGEVVDFKVMKGEFLKRRLNRVLENLAAKKIFPLDDVGVAGIHF
jgi:hypothetical protein